MTSEPVLLTQHTWQEADQVLPLRERAETPYSCLCVVSLTNGWLGLSFYDHEKRAWHCETLMPDVRVKWWFGAALIPAPPGEEERWMHYPPGVAYDGPPCE